MENYKDRPRGEDPRRRQRSPNRDRSRERRQNRSRDRSKERKSRRRCELLNLYFSRDHDERYKQYSDGKNRSSSVDERNSSCISLPL